MSHDASFQANSNGDVDPGGAPAEQLMPLVYDELRSIAAHHLRMESPGHTLQPTALVHEAYLKLARRRCGPWTDRGHFLAVASRCIRQILVSHARKRRAAKRGSGALRLTICESVVADEPPRDVDVLHLEEALEALYRCDDRQGRVVELRFYGGLSVREAARVLGVSERTVEGDWAFARAWLAERMQPTD